MLIRHIISIRFIYRIWYRFCICKTVEKNHTTLPYIHNYCETHNISWIEIGGPGALVRCDTTPDVLCVERIEWIEDSGSCCWGCDWIWEASRLDPSYETFTIVAGVTLVLTDCLFNNGEDKVCRPRLLVLLLFIILLIPYLEFRYIVLLRSLS
jgi:hypothetical protein